jgi:hypothetical protein
LTSSGKREAGVAALRWLGARSMRWILASSEWVVNEDCRNDVDVAAAEISA